MTCFLFTSGKTEIFWLYFKSKPVFREIVLWYAEVNQEVYVNRELFSIDDFPDLTDEPAIVSPRPLKEGIFF